MIQTITIDKKDIEINKDLDQDKKELVINDYGYTIEDYYFWYAK